MKKKIPKEILDKINTKNYELFDEHGPLHASDFGTEQNKIIDDLLKRGLKYLKELGYGGY